MGVYLRTADVLMAQHLLDIASIRAMAMYMNRGSVP